MQFLAIALGYLSGWNEGLIRFLITSYKETDREDHIRNLLRSLRPEVREFLVNTISKNNQLPVDWTILITRMNKDVRKEEATARESDLGLGNLTL